MKRKLSILIGVVGVLLVVAVIGFVITGKEPLYGQGRGGSNENIPIPDLVGTWDIALAGYFFEDVTETAEQPEFGVPPVEDFIITVQTGRVFAGSWDDGKQKATGVIMSDGTVSI